MQVYRETIIYPTQIVAIKEEQFPYGEFPLHNHPDYELILILKGSGKKFVGDNIKEFDCGDLSFFGSYLPHTFYNKHLSTDTEIRQIVVQFPEDFLGKDFFNSDPFLGIKSFLAKSGRGYSFYGQTQQRIAEEMIKLLQSDETQSIIKLLHILDVLSKSKEYEYISGIGFADNVNQKETDRMSIIYDYLVKHFKDGISLNDIASVVCLSPEAFCRYFKKYTRKTFFEFLVEMRIGYACKLLQKNNQTVSQISLQSGFNNISYFNRKFKSIKKKTPAEYQKAFIQQNHLLALV